jgi:hypothetical protein
MVLGSIMENETKTGMDMPTTGVYEIGGRVFRLSRPVPAVRLNFARFIKLNKVVFEEFKTETENVATAPLPSPETVTALGGIKEVRAAQIMSVLLSLMSVLEQSGKLEDMLAVGLLPEGEAETTKDVAAIAEYLKNNCEPAVEAVIFKDFFAGLWVQMAPICPPIG